jgi:hypothetical protein
MILTGKNRSTGDSKSVPVSLCPPQIPHGLVRNLTGAVSVRGRTLTVSFIVKL